MGLNFNVALDYDQDESSITLDPALTLMFGVAAYPTTVIIDSYGLIAEVGEGNLDWDEIIAACDEAGAKWALVEQDICQRDPFESIKMSYDYLKTKGFY